jgi:hypothetical protein
LFLAMDGAGALARAIVAGTPAALRRYEREQLRHIEAWRKAISYFYDGRLFALFRSRGEAQGAWLGRAIARFVSRHVGGVFTGESIKGLSSPRVLDFAIRNALGESDPELLRIL